MCSNQLQSEQSHISITFPAMITVHLTKTEFNKCPFSSKTEGGG